MLAAGVHVNVIGLSSYPWYHGPISAMKANLTALIDRFHKYVMISEDQFACPGIAQPVIDACQIGSTPTAGP